MNVKKYLIGTAVSALIFGTLAIPTFADKTATVNLGTAGNFEVLAKTGITTTGVTAITGNIGVSPIGSTAITGFGLVLDKSGTFSRSTLVTGKVYAANYAGQTSIKLTSAVSNMQTAYTNAAGRAATVTELGAGNIGGLTLKAGVYKWSSAVTISSDVTFTGDKDDVWILQIAGTLGISSGKKVILKGGVQAKNIFWQVAGVTNLGTTSVFKGIILDKTAVTMQNGAVLKGRALAQTNVTLIGNTIK